MMMKMMTKTRMRMTMNPTVLPSPRVVVVIDHPSFSHRPMRDTIIVLAPIITAFSYCLFITMDGLTDGMNGYAVIRRGSVPSEPGRVIA
jgi:hypothetical protein